jgi:hypothetical protein
MTNKPKFITSPRVALWHHQSRHTKSVRIAAVFSMRSRTISANEEAVHCFYKIKARAKQNTGIRKRGRTAPVSYGNPELPIDGKFPGGKCTRNAVYGNDCTGACHRERLTQTIICTNVDSCKARQTCNDGESATFIQEHCDLRMRRAAPTWFTACWATNRVMGKRSIQMAHNRGSRVAGGTAPWRRFL